MDARLIELAEEYEIELTEENFKAVCEELGKEWKEYAKDECEALHIFNYYDLDDLEVIIPLSNTDEARIYKLKDCFYVIVDTDEEDFEDFFKTEEEAILFAKEQLTHKANWAFN